MQRFTIHDLRRFTIHDSRRFAIYDLRRFTINDSRRFTINGSRLTTLLFCVGLALLLPLRVYAVSSTTTISLEVETTTSTPPPSGGSGGGVVVIDTVPPSIYDLVIIPSQFSATINWRTNEPAISNVFWGETADYEMGIISKTDYATNQSTIIENLRSNYSYHIKIEATDQFGNKTISRDQVFKTLGLPDSTPPANVSDLKATEGDGLIEIVWNNPPDPDFSGVRIVKNDQFYPQDPYDGEIVYQGKEEKLADKEVFNQDYYYTVFSYDSLGNYSSGAIIKAKPKKAPEPPIKPIVPPIKPPIIPPEIKELKLEDIIFMQDGRQIPIKNGNILADTGKPTKISIPYEKLPEVLKTIIINLEKCDEGSTKYEVRSMKYEGGSIKEECKNKSVFSFLLRVNDKKTAYEATILSPYEAGVYPIAVSILNFQHQNLTKLSGKLLLREQIVPIQAGVGVWEAIGRMSVILGGAIMAMVVCYAIWRVIKRKARLTISNY
jgi:hypothetical protein